MTTPARSVVGLLLFAALLAGGTALLRSGVYGLTIFIVAPVVTGGISAWVCRAGTARAAAGFGALGALGALCLLFLVGLEGAICIVMAAPLALPLGALGGWLVYHAVRPSRAARGLTMLLLLPPASLTFDLTSRPPLFEVRTTMEIAATPSQVWKHVVTFADLPEPEEWFFRAGLAFPKRARIVGAGPGAIRYCEFSTGPFVEPIDVWNEPNLLRFRVTENPAPMTEMSFHNKVVPKHLHGYLVSKQGQFRLIALAGNRTRLEGTTWYQHGLWPATYWRWWSDAIIHRIHLRVLTHIRNLAEADAR